MRCRSLAELERFGVPISPTLRAYLTARMHTNPSLSQAGFRLRNDDGSETTATWKAAENTNATIAVDENFRVRFVVDETAGGAENNTTFQLQYNLNGAGWNNVTASSLVVRSSASPNVADGTATTRQLTSGTGTFVANTFDEVDGLSGTTSFAGGELTEVEYCAQIRSVDVVDTDTIQLRVIRGSAVVLENYAQTPTITVSESGPADQNLTGAHIASGAALFAAALAYVVAPPAIAAGSVLNAPTVAYEVTAPVIASGSTLAAPTVSQEGGDQSLTGAFISSGNTVFVPSAAYVVEPPGIASGSSLAVPSVAYAVAPPAIGSTAAPNAPSLAYAVEPPAVASGSSLFAPTVSLEGGDQNVTGAFLASGHALNAPNVAHAVTAPTIPAGSALAAPTVAYAVDPPALAGGTTLSAPTITAEQLLELPTRGSTTVLFAPTAAGGALSPARVRAAAAAALALSQAEVLEHGRVDRQSHP